MNLEAPAQPRRRYRQTARARATQSTARRIANAFWDCMLEEWFDEITLDEVARRASVTVRTVIRHFGSKDGLAERFVDYVAPKVAAMRDSASGDPPSAVRSLLALYEATGDSVVRNLAQEPRYPALRTLLDGGRRMHRETTSQTYAEWLEGLDAHSRRRLLDALVIVTDVYVWKLLRRDLRRSIEETQAMMLHLVETVLTQATRPASPSEASHE